MRLASNIGPTPPPANHARLAHRAAAPQAPIITAAACHTQLNRQFFVSLPLVTLSRSRFGPVTETAVKSIKKQHLVEVRSMGNPPQLVKVALESICLLLGENATDWKAIRAVIMRENFINSIVSNFSTEDIK